MSTKQYSIDIQNPSTGEVDTRVYTMISTSSLRSRTAALRFQKAMLDLRLYKSVALDNVTDEERSEHYDTALHMMNLNVNAYEELCKTILLGDWSNTDFSLIDESVVNTILTDFFSSVNSKTDE